MRLQLVTPDRQVLDTEIEEVYAPGVQGQFGVLPQHVNFLTALDTGELRYRSEGQDHWLAVSGGVAEVLDETVTILADNAEPSEDISEDEARAAGRAAEEALEELDPSSPEAQDLQSEIAWAEARAAVAAKRP